MDMRDKLAQGEKLVVWVGSAKRDLLEFPEPVIDEIGTALSAAQLAVSIPPPSHGRDQVPVCWRLWKTMTTALIEPSTRCASRKRFMCCIASRRNPRAASKPHNRMLN